MIVRFRHKGLKLLFEKGDRRRVLPDYADKIERILARLEEASEVGSTLHQPLLHHRRQAARERRRVGDGLALDDADRFPTATTPHCIKGAGVARAGKSSNEIPHAADYRPVRIPWLFREFGKDCGEAEGSVEDCKLSGDRLHSAP